MSSRPNAFDGVKDFKSHVRVFKALKIVVHPEYKSTSFDYDFALVRININLSKPKFLYNWSFLYFQFKLGIEIIASIGTFQETKPLSIPTTPLEYSRFIRPVCLPCDDGVILHEKKTFSIDDRLYQESCKTESRLIPFYVMYINAPFLFLKYLIWRNSCKVRGQLLLVMVI